MDYHKEGVQFVVIVFGSAIAYAVLLVIIHELIKSIKGDD